MSRCSRYVIRFSNCARVRGSLIQQAGVRIVSEGCTDSRRHHAGLLTTADYNNLCQCENLDDIKMHLSATKYGSYLQNGA
ncbi:hypothetical protein YC2023_101770 [Brassica napus]